MDVPDTSLDLSTPAETSLAPPGALGVGVSSGQVLSFLNRLEHWLSTARQRMDLIATLDPTNTDLLVCLTLWQAANRRYEQLRITADGGRMLAKEELAVSGLIWGQLDGTAGLSVNLVELVPMCDALLTTVEARLRLDGGRSTALTGLRQGLVGLERLRAQVGQVRARDQAQRRLTGLETRLAQLQGAYDRGGDVTGPLAAWGTELARAERDLIVQADQEYDARARYEALLIRRDRLRELASRCIATVTPAPRLAVPDVSSLGPAPEGEAAEYLDRLTRVEQATSQAEQAYRAPLMELNRLRARGVAAQVAAAQITDHSCATDLSGLAQALETAVQQRPVSLVRVRGLVGALTGYLAGLETR